MTNLISRLVVGIIGLPVVLGLVWLGGWWLYVLVLLASLVAVHEFVTVSRPLRPLAPAIYLGVALSLTTAQTSGVVGADDEHRAEERVQKLTDEHTKQIDDLLRHKEAEVMEV